MDSKDLCTKYGVISEELQTKKFEMYTSVAMVTILSYQQVIKGPVKLIKRVKIAPSFLQSVSNQFHVIILRLPM